MYVFLLEAYPSPLETPKARGKGHETITIQSNAKILVRNQMLKDWALFHTCDDFILNLDYHYSLLNNRFCVWEWPQQHAEKYNVVQDK